MAFILCGTFENLYTGTGFPVHNYVNVFQNSVRLAWCITIYWMLPTKGRRNIREILFGNKIERGN